MARRLVVLLAAAGLLAASSVWARASSPSSVSWPPHQALPHFAAPQHLDVADVSSLPGDQQLLFNTLEGLVNRAQPRIYLLWNADEGKRTWLNTLNSEFGVPSTDVGDKWDTLSAYLLTTYRLSFSGMIIYDPSVPDSINVATSLAEPDNAIVASPDVATLLAPYKIPVVNDTRLGPRGGDLRGRFLSRLDAYQWEYDNLWVPGAVTHRMLVGLPPFQSASVHLAILGGSNIPEEPVYDSGAFPGEPFPSLRDYAVAAGAMVVWLNHNDPAERALLEKILSAMPPDSPYLGTHAGDVAGEITIVALLSQHSVYEVAADYFNNGSVLGGVRPAHLTRASAGQSLAIDRNKIYVTFTMSDGDNIQYDQRFLRKEWDAAHSPPIDVPINWTISPLLLDAAPAIFDHYTRTATPNDLFMAGPSGAGYAYPSSWPDETFRTFTGQTGTYMRQAGITTLDILNAPNGIRMPLTQTDAHDYVRDVAPAGMMLNYNFFPECRTDNVMIERQTPVTTGCIVSSDQAHAQGEAQADVQQQAARCPVVLGQPCFISIEFTVWNITPADVAAVANTLSKQDSRYSFVRADQYFDLLRQANQGP